MSSIAVDNKDKTQYSSAYTSLGLWIRKKVEDPTTMIPVLNLRIYLKNYCKFEFHYSKLGELTENKAGYILNLMDEVSEVFFTKNE